jgi:hypothetical protein
MGLTLSLLAFATSWLCGRRSLGAGMAVVLATGYSYAILRANFFDGYSHFIFDCAVLALYMARLTLPGAFPARARGLAYWVAALTGWPILLFGLFAFSPQHPLIQLVGLRGAIWFLPFLLLGATARAGDLTVIARALAILNLVALGFAVGEYVLGLEPFFPRNAMTDLMYRSTTGTGDILYYRIPATFGSSASYGGVMVGTVPLLVGYWVVPRRSLLGWTLISSGLLAAALGAFMCGSRAPVVLLLGLSVVVAYYCLRARLRYLTGAVLIAAAVGYLVAGNERLQRFATLQDTEYVASRLGGSANIGVVELILEYPQGVGLGGAFGTSIPPFLKHLAVEQIGAENEYSRIGLEQGLAGLSIWLAFLVWAFARRPAYPSPTWALGATLMFAYAVLVWGTSFIGAGLLMSVPAASLLLFQIGVFCRERGAPVPVRGSPVWGRTESHEFEGIAAPWDGTR